MVRESKLHNLTDRRIFVPVEKDMAGGRVPKLPKRSVIERITKKSSQCLPEMMSVLNCMKDSNFNDTKCSSEMLKLTECVSRQASYTHSCTFHLCYRMLGGALNVIGTLILTNLSFSCSHLSSALILRPNKNNRTKVQPFTI